MVAATAAVIGLAALLVVGGVGVVQTVISPTRASAEAPPTPDTGAQAPVSDPLTPPDRVSDQTEAVPVPDTIYTISEGDTLTWISSHLNVSIDAIASYNAIRDVDVISSGAVLRVPGDYVPPESTQ